MIDFLAQQTSNGDVGTIIGATVTTVVLALGGREGIAALQRRRANGSAYNHALCDERHQRIDKDMDALFKKLDQIHEAILKK